jgi:hypothetical protein
VVFAGLAWRGSLDANQIAREAVTIGKEADHLANSAHIDFDIDPDSDDQQVGFAIRSTGHGTAVLGEIQYVVDGRPAKDLDDALTASNLDPDMNRGWYIEPGYLMAPGEVEWLLDYHSKDKTVNDRLAGFVQRVSIRVSYCSVTHECTTSCYPDSTCRAPAASDAGEIAAKPLQEPPVEKPPIDHRRRHHKAHHAN